jgi:hypothetical protein
MNAPDIETALGWRGRTVRDRNGEELGKLGELYLDSGSDRPAWGSVKRGLVRTTETIVPLGEAQEDGKDLRLPYDRALIEEAPDVDPDVELSEDQERILHEHYGRDWAPASDEETDTAMTRSEEEVTFGTRPVQRAERVRLKKVLVHDEVEKTVPVRREEIRLETDPPPEGRIESVEDVPDDRRT